VVRFNDFIGEVQSNRMFSRPCTFLPGVLLPEGSPDPVWRYGAPSARRRSVEGGNDIMEMSVEFPPQHNDTSSSSPSLFPRQNGPLVERLAPSPQQMPILFGDDYAPGSKVKIVGVRAMCSHLSIPSSANTYAPSISGS